MPKKPKRVWVGNTPVTPITPKERRKLHKLMKKRLDMRRRRYFEVRGKVVDYIRYSIDDGVLCMNACFRDKTPLFPSIPFSFEIVQFLPKAARPNRTGGAGGTQSAWVTAARSLAARLSSTKKSTVQLRNRVDRAVAGRACLAEASNVNGLRREPSLWTQFHSSRVQFRP